MRRLPVCRSRLSTWAPRVLRATVLGKGRRRAGAPRRLELFAQAFVFPTQPFDLAPQCITLALRTFRALAQSIDVVRRWSRISGPLIRHAAVMPDPRTTYKYEILDRALGAGDGGVSAPANQRPMILWYKGCLALAQLDESPDHD
jgi:hypothetical protein